MSLAALLRGGCTAVEVSRAWYGLTGSLYYYFHHSIRLFLGWAKSGPLSHDRLVVKSSKYRRRQFTKVTRSI